MKIALVGNSHLGRLKKVWDGWCTTKTRMESEYFIHRSTGPHPLTIDGHGGGTTFPQIGLMEDKVLHPEGVDAVVVVGMSFGLQRALELGQRYLRPGMPMGSGYLLTRASWDSALDDILLSSHCGEVVRAVRQADDTVPIVVLPHARPLEWVTTREGLGLGWAERVQEIGAQAAYAQRWDEARHRFAEQLGVRVLDQPVETTTDRVWTRARFGFAQESDPTSPYWQKGDYYHMNDDYARAVAPHLMELLRSLGERPRNVGSPVRAGV